MKMKIIIYIVLITNALSCCGQNKSIKTITKLEVDTIGINISRAEFNSIITANLQRLENEIQLSIENSIELVRAVNTIDYYSMKDVDSKKLIEIFYNKYFEEVIKKIEAKDWKGGCQYSIKYNIFIGGKPHDNSQYLITN